MKFNRHSIGLICLPLNQLSLTLGRFVMSLSGLWAPEIRETNSFDVPSVNSFYLKLSMPGLASFLFQLKNGVLRSDVPRSFGLGKKLMHSMLIVLVTKGIKIFLSCWS